MQIFVKTLQIIYQQISNHQKLNYLRWLQSGVFLGRLLGPLLKTGLPFIKSDIKPLAKSVLISLGLHAAASAADAGIHKNILGSGYRPSSSAWRNNTTILIVSNNEIQHIIKIVKYFEESGLLLRGVTKTVQNEIKEQKGGFLSMLLGTWGASLLGNPLTGKGINGAGKGKGINRAGEGVLTVGYGSRSSKMYFSCRLVL